MIRKSEKRAFILFITKCILCSKCIKYKVVSVSLFKEIVSLQDSQQGTIWLQINGRHYVLTTNIMFLSDTLGVLPLNGFQHLSKD